MPIEDELQDRRNDYDVTNTVQVSSAPQVRAAVADLFAALYPSSSFDSVWLAFHDFERVFRGLDPNYHAVDTTYHDMQHTLDMTLALARLIAGHEMSVEPGDRLGPDRAELAIVSALFHDVGYLRHRDRDAAAVNGAVFTRVARDAQRSLSRELLAAHRPRAIRARRLAHRAFHGLRAQRRSDRARGTEGQRRRPLARHRRSRSRSLPTAAI